MKLTKEQVEIERSKFEECFNDEGYVFNRSEKGFYINQQTQSRFRGWISCRESNNEIIAPAKIQIHSRLGERYLNGMNDGIDKFTDALESQGYTIKESK